MGTDIRLPDPSLELAAGFYHTCLLRTNGRIVCWGAWQGGQGRAATTHMVVDAGTPATRFAAIGAGGHTCGLTQSGEAYCWGENRYGQLGDATTISRSAPARVATPLRFTAIAAGASSTCGLTTTGRAYCWGQADYGALGNGVVEESSRESSPVQVAGENVYRHIAGGTTYCVLDHADLVNCWGSAEGTFAGVQLPGDCGDRFYRFVLGRPCAEPTPLAGDVVFKQLTVGGDVACGLDALGAAYCWGDGFFGTLGNGYAGSGVHSVEPTRVTGGLTFTMVSAGGVHVCGLTADRQAYCWGNNFRGQLGNGEGGPSHDGIPIMAQPVRVTGSHRFVTLSTGAHHTCGIAVEGEVWCWGSNGLGASGQDESVEHSNVPVRVILPGAP
jgi:alpha-tubulin suppressor-like RCC1 family protein